MSLTADTKSLPDYNEAKNFPSDISEGIFFSN